MVLKFCSAPGKKLDTKKVNVILLKLIEERVYFIEFCDLMILGYCFNVCDIIEAAG